MTHANEPPKQALAIDVAAEVRQAAAAGQRPRLPITPRIGVNRCLEMALVIANVLARVRLAKEAIVRVPSRQILEAGQLQLDQCHMRPVEIDRRDLVWAGGEIGQDIAPAGRNGDNVMMRLDLHRRHIDHRILPDLRIDQTAEGEREEALENALLGNGLIAVHGPPKKFLCARLRSAARVCRRHVHPVNHHLFQLGANGGV